MLFAQHMSAGAMSLKKREFRNLRQGNRTMAQYVDEFSTLSRYALDDVAQMPLSRRDLWKG